MIEVKTVIRKSIRESWELWTKPEHVIHWNFAIEDWECPKAESNFIVGGEFHYLMRAKDKSMEFDFCGTFTEIQAHNYIGIVLGDGRKMEVHFSQIQENETEIMERFEPENQNPIDLQQQGWQAILTNFATYANQY